MKLSILDQVPVFKGASAKEAITATLELAEMADQLGFARYWVAEHHDMKSFACPAPDIILGLIGSQTEKIKIGAGAVLLPHYRPFHIAERYNLLATLYPKRIDVGIGRAPGGSAEATIALSGNFLKNVRNVSADIDELVAFFNQTFAKDHLYAKIAPTPVPNYPPDLWLLGTSEKSAKLAAEKDMSYVFGHFMTEKDGPAIVKQYRQQAKGKVIVAVSVICAETYEQAKKLAEMALFENVELEKGLKRLYPTATQRTMEPNISNKDEALSQKRKTPFVFGNPLQVYEQLQALQAIYQADEIMILTNIPDYELRRNSYQFIAQTCF